MTAGDVGVAALTMRRAFGVYLNVPDPDTTFGAAHYVGPRFLASPATAFVATDHGEVVGAVHATLWGSFGFFGPLVVRPDRWDRGVARQLLAPVVDLFDRSDTVLTGLFTFAQSAKHVGLCQRFGYWPQYLTAIMNRPVGPDGPATPSRRFSEVSAEERTTTLLDCAVLSDRVFAGLDVGVEISAVFDQQLGDTVLIDDDVGLVAFAVCHVGAGEADTGACYVKFAAARPGSRAGDHFTRLFDAIEALAGERGATHVVAGVDTARREAYRALLERGFRTGGQGVRMHRPDDLGYGHVNTYVIDDLR
ncbi:MAG: GNAT family N-acetyltransferase [Acidimicrobiales bacterium]